MHWVCDPRHPGNTSVAQFISLAQLVRRVVPAWHLLKGRLWEPIGTHQRPHSVIGTTMAQVAYHVQLTWLLVTAVTPDRLESTRSDELLWEHYTGRRVCSEKGPREHALHLFDDSILSLAPTNRVRPGADRLRAKKRFCACQGTASTDGHMELNKYRSPPLMPLSLMQLERV